MIILNQYVNEFIKMYKNISNNESLVIKFLEHHSFEQMDIFLAMNREQKEFIFNNLTFDELSNIYKNIEEDQIKSVLNLNVTKFNCKIIEKMSIDDSVNILRKLELEKQYDYLSYFSYDLKSEIINLLQYNNDSAGALITNSYIVVEPNDSVKNAMKKMISQAKKTDNINNIYVIKKNKLVGVLTLKELIIASKDEIINDFMNKKYIYTNVTENKENVAIIMKDYDLISLPVLDDDKKLIGIITIDDIVDVIEEEANDDYSKFAAISDADIDIKTETVLKSVKKRIPWLISLLLIGVIVSNVIATYEHILSEIIVLSFFMTSILDMAGNTGTQSLAVTVRGLSTKQLNSKKNILKHIYREFLTGLTNGTLISILVFVVSYLFLHFRDISPEYNLIVVSSVISLSMLISLTISTLAGAIIPLFINKFKIDPAVASGPFITTINDIIGLTVYFQLSSWILLN